MKFRLISLLMLVFSVAACNSTKKVDGDKQASVTDVQWNLVKLSGENPSAADLSKHKVYFTLRSENQNASGNDGCNNFMGSFSIGSNNRIDFGRFGVTKRACMDWQKMEGKVLAVFRDAHSYAIENDKLHLKDQTGNTLAVFQKAEENASSAITEKYWKLLKMNGKTVEMGSYQKREPYFMLKTGGQEQVKGFAGCNSFSGSYTLKENAQIHFDKMASTLKACPNLDFNEGEFLNVFRDVKTYVIQGDKLFFKDADNNTLASFKAVYMD